MKPKNIDQVLAALESLIHEETNKFQASGKLTARQRIALQAGLPLDLLPDVESFGSVDEMRKAAELRRLEQIRPVAKAFGNEDRIDALAKSLSFDVSEAFAREEKTLLLEKAERLRPIARRAGTEHVLDAFIARVDAEGAALLEKARERNLFESCRPIARQAGTERQLDRRLEEL